MQQKIYRDVWKLSKVREIIANYKKGDYGDDKVISCFAALSDITAMVKEDE